MCSSSDPYLGTLWWPKGFILDESEAHESTNFAIKRKLLLLNILLKRKQLSQTNDFAAIESNLSTARKSFYDNRFLVHNPGYSRGKWLFFFLLYTHLFMRENRTTIQILRKRNLMTTTRTTYAFSKAKVWDIASSFLFFLLSKPAMLTLLY